MCSIDQGSEQLSDESTIFLILQHDMQQHPLMSSALATECFKEYHWVSLSQLRNLIDTFERHK